MTKTSAVVMKVYLLTIKTEYKGARNNDVKKSPFMFLGLLFSRHMASMHLNSFRQICMCPASLADMFTFVLKN